MFARLLLGLAALASVFPPTAAGDGPADNDPRNVRRIPPWGIELPAADQDRLRERLAKLDEQLRSLGDDPRRVDIEVLQRAVRVALEHREFFDPRDLDAADRLLQEAERRAAQLRDGQADWDSRPGLAALGFRSRLDGTVQPYGLIVPDSYRPGRPGPWRLDLWFHGRGETVGELRFLDQRLRQRGTYAPENTFVLHPYGRYSNAFKFAGEVDVWEALADARRRFPIDPDRISVRGFSMGGAGCWQFAVHYPDRFFAANPGAGFSETPEFLKFFQQEQLDPPDHERILWSLYDCPGYAINLFHLPTIAYSGELDRQKQAADVMAEALRREGLNLLHVVGPGTEHKIHPDSAAEIERRMNELARQGRQRNPREVHFQTYTLKYNQAHWIRLDRLQQHWRKSRVDAMVVDESLVQVSTQNLAGLTLRWEAGSCPLNPLREPRVEIDGRTVAAALVRSDRSLEMSFVKDGDLWRWTPSPPAGLGKRHNLQGPIDDAFMDAFLVVRPTGEPWHAETGAWVNSELERAITQWRQQFRGEARVRNDVEVSDEDIAGRHLILFGDPQSNRLLAGILERLPLEWTSERLTLQSREADAAVHVPLMIYPNPLNPDRYVVLNSGFTYREYDYLNNARQTPKLPDWAIVDVRTPPGPRFPGKIVAADFFDEDWR